MPRQNLIQHRRGTAAAWAAADPVLAAGEPGFETDTGLTKVGDGDTAWSDLSPLARQDEVILTGSTITDDETSTVPMLDLWHYGSAGSASYGLDFANWPGAKSAIVVHQYSAAGPAVWLDNTDSNDTIYISNTENETRNPGGIGSGNAVRFIDHGVTRFLVSGKGTLLVAPASTATVPAINITHAHAQMGVVIASTAAAAGWYPLNVTGHDQGVNITVGQNFGVTLNLTKNGTGSGDVLRVTNKGTGPTALFKTAAGSVSQVNPDGEFEHLTAGKGLILKSPDGTRYRVAVANGGTVSVVAA